MRSIFAGSMTLHNTRVCARVILLTSAFCAVGGMPIEMYGAVRCQVYRQPGTSCSISWYAGRCEECNGVGMLKYVEVIIVIALQVVL